MVGLAGMVGLATRVGGEDRGMVALLQGGGMVGLIEVAVSAFSE